MNEAPTPRRSPLFRLLESYVLDAIGHLSPKHDAETARLVRLVFRSRAPWRTVLQEEFGFAAGLGEQLKELWQQGQTVAAENGTELSPRDFATMVVDENFADSLEMLATELTAHLDSDSGG